MSTTYKATKGALFGDEQAALYGTRLTELKKENKVTVLTPGEIVDDAKNKKTPYHNYFQWDNTKAGDSWRIQQARQLINHIDIIVVVDEKPEPIRVRAFHSVDSDGKKGYIDQKTVFNDSAMREQVIEQALMEIQAWNAKWETYTELALISESINTVVAERKALKKG